MSNLENSMEKALSISSKLTSLWASSDYGRKQKLQNLIFPEGIVYNRKNDECRTLRVNNVFLQNAEWARILTNKKSENSTNNCYVAALAVGGGVEPPRGS